MKRFALALVAVPLVLVLAMLTSGCTIMSVEQPAEAYVGDAVTLKVTCYSPWQPGNENNINERFVLCVMVPEDWTYTSGTYDVLTDAFVPIGSGVGELTPNATITSNWGDSAAAIIPPPAGMKWLGLAADRGHTFADSIFVIATLNMQVGNMVGDFDLGYLMTYNDPGSFGDFAQGFTDTAMGYRMRIKTTAGPKYSGVAVCQPCHNTSSIGGTQYTSWALTRHAVAYDSVAIIQNNADCLPCHTTGWDPFRENGGFDDAYNAQPPDQAGIDKMKNVQCESCHGPVEYGVNHGDASTLNPTAEMCGRCHEGTHHPYYSEWTHSAHSYADTNASAYLAGQFRTNRSCAGCHTYQGFVQFAKQTSLEPDVDPPGDASQPLVCAACHDPHGNANPGGLRLATAAICVKCHNPEYPPDQAGTQVGQAVHHSTAYMFEGIGGYEFAGYTYTSSVHKFVVTRKCAECHVFMTPYVSEEQPASTGHKFEPSKYACAQAACHSQIDTTQSADVIFDYKRRQTECDSMAAVLASKLAAASSADSATDAFKRAEFNYEFFTSDGSHGVHNTNYAKGLLESAIINFNPSGVERLADVIPAEFRLAQNYPNPFNPTTEITFSLPRNAHVKVDVYAMSGELIATIVDENLGAGTFRVTWNGRDGAGRSVSSGVYLYRMHAGDFTMTRKMVLLK